MFVHPCVPCYGSYPVSFSSCKYLYFFALVVLSVSSEDLNVFGDLCCAVFIGVSVQWDPSTWEYTRTAYAR